MTPLEYLEMSHHIHAKGHDDLLRWDISYDSESHTMYVPILLEEGYISVEYFFDHIIVTMTEIGLAYIQARKL